MAADALSEHQEARLHYKKVRLKGLTLFSLDHHTPLYREV
jgi:hypothetical protein